MLVACWSAKGGTGTTTVAVALAAVLAQRSPDGALLADLAGDVPAVLGLPEPEGPGLAEWLAAGPAAPADALGRLEVRVRPGLRLLPRGRGPLDDVDRAEVLVTVLAGESRPVVVDVGSLTPHEAGAGEALRRSVAAGAGRSLLVTRGTYVELRRAAALPLKPSALVLLTERGRMLSRADVESVAGAPVLAEIPVQESVLRAVDSGSLAARVPGVLARALRWAA